MSELEQLAQQERRYRYIGLFGVVFLFGGFLIWAALAPLQSSVVSDGKILVESRNVIVQHYDGGVVSEIFIKEGQVVQKGDPLLNLSTGSIQIELDALQDRYFEAQIQEFLLTKELQLETEITWPNSLITLTQDSEWALYLQSALQAHQANIGQYLDQQALLQTKIRQSKSQQISLKDKLKVVQSRIDLYVTDIEDQERLFAQQLTDKRRLSELKIEHNYALSEAVSLKQELNNLGALVKDTELQINLLQQQRQQKNQEKLLQQKSIALSLAPKIELLQRKLNRAELLAPHAGTVLDFSIHSVGQIIAPQSQVLEIVPNDQSFIIEAKVKPQDIELIKVGQEVDIKFVAFNIRFEYAMYGLVESIGADVKQDEMTREPYYQVMVKPTVQMLNDIQRNQWQVISGMPVALFVQTRRQTLAQYLLRPFEKAILHAFNEDDGLR